MKPGGLSDSCAEPFFLGTDLYTILYLETGEPAKPAHGAYNGFNSLRVINGRGGSDPDPRLQLKLPPRCLVWVAVRSTGRCRQNLIRWQSVSADQREALPQPQASRSWFSFDRTVLVFVLVLKPRPVYAWLRCRSLPNWASDGCRMRTKSRGACV